MNEGIFIEYENVSLRGYKVIIWRVCEREEGFGKWKFFGEDKVYRTDYIYKFIYTI